jgi:hypothetical protein
MNSPRLIPAIALLVATSFAPAAAQQPVKLGQNAALRYWSAFALVQDSAITDQEANDINQILDGGSAYDDLKYKDLVAKNQLALDTMGRGSGLPYCDWGVDYPLGSEAPVDYVRKGLALGRLNVLYAYHLSSIGDKDGAVRALGSGLRFSHDVANGGSLFAAVAATDLIVTHLRVVAFELRSGGGLSAQQKVLLQTALRQLGSGGLDWISSINREFEAMHEPGSNPSPALEVILPLYLRTLSDGSLLPRLQQAIASAPQPVIQSIPNPARVLKEKAELSDLVAQTRSLLR